MSEWRAIESAPRDMTPVLVWLSVPHQNSHVHTAQFAPNMPRGIIGGLFGFDLKGDPTHWMPLPEPPPQG